ncbi:unnamed protein product [Parnassius apollo]|uniref:(apollo) hypothetical protein n=1 Tax=Parnassius apollo TaxID=110799 RepID=A0A8S3XVE0_PARAO|nr:unnamed protein product [Parnassius apollo]
MCFKILLACLFQLTAVYSAPLHPQVLQPSYQKTSVQPSHQMLQQQLLQQLQNFQQLNTNNFGQLSFPPVLILIPKDEANTKTKHTKNEATKSKQHSNKERVDEDLDSVIIDADSNESEIEPQRTAIILPNFARISIGGIISAIPFLPIEINVPDTIGWAYNGISSGISSIISIIGQRLPFTSSSMQDQENKLRSVLQQLQMKKQNSFVPIIIMPISPQIIPMQLPIQV